MRRLLFWSIGIVLVAIIIVTIGGSFYMLDYSLSPNPDRKDTALSFRQQFEKYPETRPWMDSLRQADALRDTFITMPNGERHHALYVRNGGKKTALVIHGWRNNSINFLHLARLYEKELGYNVVIPDVHAHGLSEGDMIQMGWLDRNDALHWLSVFNADTIAVHGVSMGAATAMMLSAETMPKGIKDIRFIEDCGYTSVWDEFAGELKNQFGLPEFPLMYTTSLLSKISNGWSFGEASAINQVKRCSYPILFIHGGSDTFVPTDMVYRLYKAKASKKKLWIANGAKHAESYKKHREKYVKQVKDFLNKQ
jgi:fermentation-respiration switch protein FrsA (DUF1100 family)